MKNKISISPATWVIVIVSLIIGGYSYWFYTHFDKVIKEVDLGPTKEVKANPFFAAEKFLEKSNKVASSQRNFSVLDSGIENQDTLIIESTRVGLSENKRNTVKDWLNNGGHIILLATEIYDDDLGTSRDLLLDELGVRLYENPEYSWSYDEDEQLTRVTFQGTDQVTAVNFRQNYYLQDSKGEATFIGGNDYSDSFAQYQVGEGMVTVVTDMSVWKNYSIDEHDHAMFLYQLVGGGRTVMFLYNTVQPSLWSTMKELIPKVIISFIVLIAGLLFSASWRKGAPRKDDERVQRELMQHIEAAGEFNYRNDAGLSLLNKLSEALEIRLRKSIHQYSTLSDAKKIEKLSHLVGIEKKKLELLWQPPEQTQEDFLERVVLIQNIKRQL